MCDQVSIYIIRNEVQEGPYPLEQINQMLADKTLKTLDIAWYEGLETWITVKDIPGINLAPVKVIKEVGPQLKSGPLKQSGIESLKQDREILTREGLAVLMRWGLNSIQIPNSSKNSNFSCPKCGCDSVQSIPALCEGGSHTLNTTTRSTGMLVDGDGFDPMISVGRSSGSVVSALAQRFSPPKIKIPRNPEEDNNKVINYFQCSIMAYALFCICICFYYVTEYWAYGNQAPYSVFRVSFLPSLGVLAISFIYNEYCGGNKNKIQKHMLYKKEAKLLQYQWVNSWYCNKCGYFGLLN
jgi:hypothetical protein